VVREMAVPWLLQLLLWASHAAAAGAQQTQPAGSVVWSFSPLPPPHLWQSSVPVTDAGVTDGVVTCTGRRQQRRPVTGSYGTQPCRQGLLVTAGRPGLLQQW
jgi:hypothetical protein